MGLSFAEYVLMSPLALDTLRDAYLTDVTEGGTWGAEVEARHLAENFGVRVVFWVNSIEGRFQAVHRYGTAGQELHLVTTGNHFEALRVPPTDGEPFSRAHVSTNSGGGDCLYLAFHQALTRNDNEPSNIGLRAYRGVVARSMRREPDLDLEGLLVVLLEEFEDWGFALGAGHTLQRAIGSLYRQYMVSATEGGGSIPPFGYKPRVDLTIGMRDFVPRGRLSRADRMLDRIGRLIATQKSVHVAVALDGDALVMSANDDTDNVRKGLSKLIARYGTKGSSLEDDPLHGLDESTLRVKSDVKFGSAAKTRRHVDIAKLKALQSGALEEPRT